MGKAKSKLVRRTVNGLIEKGINFSEKFQRNKDILKNTMPSKKIRNQIAGLASRNRVQHRIAEEQLLKSKN